MKYTIPDYYRTFRCIASECPATCCAGWQIVIDEKSLKRYRQDTTAFGNRLRNSIDWENQTFLQYDGRCAFLNEENLCDIYTESGEKSMCRTCRKYPRHIEEFENEREYSLSVSCPVVAKMLLEKKEKVRFWSKEDEREEEPDDTFDFFLYSALQDSRQLMIETLQNREESISFRMAKVLALAHDIQNRIDARRIFEVEDLLERYRRPGADEGLKRKFQVCRDLKKAEYFLKELPNLLGELEVLDPVWRQTADANLRNMEVAIKIEEYSVPDDTFNVDQSVTDNTSHVDVTLQFTSDCPERCSGAFLHLNPEFCGAKSHEMRFLCTAKRVTVHGVNSNDVTTATGNLDSHEFTADDTDWQKDVSTELSSEELAQEQLMVYFIYTYFCGAVYDGDAFSKVKMAIVSTLMMERLEKAARLEKSGALTVDERAEIVWSFSRELEHSDLNLNHMEEMMRTKEAAEFKHLLAAVLCR